MGYEGIVKESAPYKCVTFPDLDLRLVDWQPGRNKLYGFTTDGKPVAIVAVRNPKNKARNI